MLSHLFCSLTESRHLGALYTRDNDPVRYMRELEFRNTIDQYDCALVMFFDKNNDECKRSLNSYKAAAKKARGKATFIVISSKHATDLADELGVDSYPAFISFRYGTMIDKLPNTTQGQSAYWYVLNATNSKYKYVNHPEDVHGALSQHNVSIVIAIPDIPAKLDKVLTVVGTKFMSYTQIWIAQTPGMADAFGVKFNSLTIIRKHDDKNITYDGDLYRATTKGLINFIEKNIHPRFDIMTSTYSCVPEGETYFAAFYDFNNKTQSREIVKILDIVANAKENIKADFKIRYADSSQLAENITRMFLENETLPLLGFFRVNEYTYDKYVFNGDITAENLVNFVNNQMANKNKLHIHDTSVTTRARSRYPLIEFSANSLRRELDGEKDLLINFVGFPCRSCEESNDLMFKTAMWARDNSIKNVVFGTINASVNDIPNFIWRNETYPYMWLIPKNRSLAWPIGKRKHIYLMAEVLRDNITNPVKVKMPSKPVGPYSKSFIKEDDNNVNNEL